MPEIVRNTDFEARHRSRKPTKTLDDAKIIYNLPFNDLLFRAQTVHRANFDPNAVQMSRLLSIKTGDVRRIADTAVSRRIIRPD